MHRPSGSCGRVVATCACTLASRVDALRRRDSGGSGLDGTPPGTPRQMVMEEIGVGQNTLHFHVRCFNMWDELCRSAST
jgi:hypothetical protein